MKKIVFAPPQTGPPAHSSSASLASVSLSSRKYFPTWKYFPAPLHDQSRLKKIPKGSSPRQTSARDLEHRAVAASPTRPRGRPSARRTRKIPFDCFIASASTSISRAPFRVRRAHPLTSSSGSFPRDRPSPNLHPRARASLVAPFLSRAFTRGE